MFFFFFFSEKNIFSANDTCFNHGQSPASGAQPPFGNHKKELLYFEWSNSDILSGSLSHIRSDILSGILSDKYAIYYLLYIRTFYLPFYIIIYGNYLAGGEISFDW